MSVPQLAIERRPAAVAAGYDPAQLGARVLVVAGLALIAGTLALVALIERAGVPAGGHPATASALVHLGTTAVVLPLAALMLARIPWHPIGWVLSAVAVSTSLDACASEYATYSHFVRALPAAVWVGWLSEWVSAPIVLLPAVALLIFPTGRPLSRRWRPALWCGLAATVLVALNGMLGPGEDLAFQGNPLLPEATARAVGEPFGIGWFLMILATAAGIAAIVARRRSATGEMREQLQLLLRAALVVALGFLACAVGSLVSSTALDFGAYLAVSSLAVLAAAMAVAILRHRLYGLDVYVDRALVLSGLTVALGGLYVAAVLGMGRLLGQEVQLGIALPATALVVVAFQPLRDRLQRSVNRLLHGQRDEPYAAISTLGRRLGAAMPAEHVLPVMVETIADALRLPYVAVELAEEPDAPAAVHGTPAAGVALRLPLVHAGERLGDADRRLLEDFARRASAAASAVALSVEVAHARARLVSAREEELRRLRGDLHDGLGPTLAGAVLTIDAARRMLTADPQSADRLLDQAAASVEGSVSDIRRLVYGLRPPALDQLGLAGALRQHASTLSAGDTLLSCDVVAPDPLPTLPAAVEVAAFRIAQEALTNVVRHARARRATVRVTVGDALDLEVADDGRGMPPDPRAGVGLTSMRERANELGGAFEIATDRSGTRIRVCLPLAGSAAQAPAVDPD